MIPTIIDHLRENLPKFENNVFGFLNFDAVQIADAKDHKLYVTESGRTVSQSDNSNRLEISHSYDILYALKARSEDIRGEAALNHFQNFHSEILPVMYSLKGYDQTYYTGSTLIGKQESYYLYAYQFRIVEKTSQSAILQCYNSNASNYYEEFDFKVCVDRKNQE